MSELRIQLQIPELPGATPVTVEVLDERMEVARRLVVRGSETVSDLLPGFYLARAHLPSGETASAHAVLAEGGAVEVKLTAAASPHEGLAWQKFLGAYPAPAAGAVSKGEISFGPGTLSPDEPELWMRIWRLKNLYSHSSGYPFEDPAAWELEEVRDRVSFPVKDAGLKLCEIRARGQDFAYRILQVGGEALPWRFIVLPPTPESVQVLIRPSRSGKQLNAGEAIKIATQDRDAETLSHYLLSGDYQTAELLANEVLDTAEDLLRSKMRNPYGALIGGYYLLQSGDLQRLHNWPNNFANWIDWLPDSAVIHAWQILYDPQLSDKTQARARLLEAARRGLPVFKQGLRHLTDGLAMFAKMARQEKQEDPEVDGALAFIRRYTRCVDWNQRFVTFYGETPAAPALEPVTGVPTPPPGQEKQMALIPSS